MTRTMLKIICLLVASYVSIYAQQAPGYTNKWEPAIVKFEESDRQAPPAQGAVLFIGSSSIAYWSHLAESFPDTKVINRGFGGSQIADSTYFADRIVAPYHPRMIVLYAGDNDLASGKTPEQVFEAYKEFVNRVRQQLPAARVAYISIKPSPARAALMPKMKAANEMIKNYAEHEKNLAYIDVYTKMLGSDGQPRPELFGPDKLHMNTEGYKLWTSIIAPYLK